MSTWTYAASALFIVVLFAYAIFFSKTYIEQKKISTWDARSAALSAIPGQKAAENTITTYQKKLADYKTLSANHTISSHVFSFIEERTLPNVWFSSFSMAESIQELVVAGEAQDMTTLSKQTKLFEQSTQYIKTMSVLNADVGTDGKVKFTINLTLDPAIFNYGSVPLPPKASSQNPL